MDSEFYRGVVVGIIVGVLITVTIVGLLIRAGKSVVAEKKNDPADWWKRGEQPPDSSY